MPRIHPAAPDQYVPLFGEDAPVRLQIYAQRPPLARKYLELGQALREERLLPDRLIELVRLRIAFWNQCRSCMATRYEEAVADGVIGGTRLLARAARGGGGPDPGRSGRRSPTAT